MAFLQPTIFFLLLLPYTILSNHDCSPHYCGSNPFPVLFPFRLQPNRCGYPGFDLSCARHRSTLTLTLPHSGPFLLRSVNYLIQELYLLDPDSCLPARLLTLNLSASPFLLPAAPSRNFTFLRCPPDAVAALSSSAVIACLSNATSAVVATSSAEAARRMAAGACGVVAADVAVPVTWPQNGEGWLTSAAGAGRELRLTWDEPDCQGCVARGGVCGFVNGTSDQISCFANPKIGPSRGLQIFKIIALSIVIPCIICSICISCFTCIVERRASRRSAVAAAAEPPLPPPSAAAISGLDDSTIESYTKVVLGESKRLPGPNGATCPICLVDYNPNDAVRCIPECEHCFHSDCVDGWLRLNSSCPVCRNSPSRSVVVTVT